LVANVEGNLAGTANAANVLTTARTISATGDAAWSVSFDGSANATAALTLANTGVTATTYGTTTAVPTIAIDAKGRITSASNTNIAFPVTTVNGASGTVVLTTSNITEGSNQYFTSARAQASITGGASSVVTADLTASRALVSDGSGKIAASGSTTATEIGYVAGVTSAIQTQLNSKLNLSGGTLTGGLSGTTLGLSGALTGTSATFSGNVGIGGTPTQKLEVIGNVLVKNTLSNASFYLAQEGDNSSTFYQYNNGTIKNVISSNGNSYITGGNFGIGVTNPVTAKLCLQVANSGSNQGGLDITNGANASFNVSLRTDITEINAGGTGNMVFSNTAERMRITSGGDLGIGTSTINYAAGGRRVVEINGPSTTLLAFKIADTPKSYLFHIGSDFIINNLASGYLGFENNGAERMRITSAGRVGVGTTDVDAKFKIFSNDEANLMLATTTKSSVNIVAQKQGIGYAPLTIDAENQQFLISGSEKMRIMPTYTSFVNTIETTCSTGGQTGLQVQNTSNNTSANAITFRGWNASITGTIATYVNLTTYNTSSDYRLKEDLKEFDGLDIVSKLKMYDFKWKEADWRMYGGLAHEIAEVVPYAVNGEKDAVDEEGNVKSQGVDYSTLVPLLIKAIQELTAKVEALEAK
jgi:hypothetical protein